MTWALIIVAVLVICFGGVLIFGAPYLPTLKKQINIALDLSGLKPGETLLELGSGDGRVLLAAARRGYQAVGYELNPLLVLFSIILTWRYRKLVKIRWANFLRVDWPEAKAVFVFGLDRLMPQIDRKMSSRKLARLISFGFKVPDKKPSHTRSGVYVYEYN